MAAGLRKQQIVIVNTGCANIASVKFAFDRLGVDVDVSDNPEIITRADKVILPGVGSANAAMASIHAKGLAPTLRDLTQPVLGVCLGMQLMVSWSAESTSLRKECLDLIPGAVERLEAIGKRLPHMGWNTVTPTHQNDLFKGIDAGSYFYFVHSFAVKPFANTLATCEYGSTFSAAIQRDNFFGAQFHPERSGPAGAKLLNNFVSL
ncbi:imidazole glycerol phosphate synthase subunit HisH [Alteromonas oceanisediminis]|uniref:imidazole glycerol phosphate synthase subunit HisH n=1 Tax=Alteromonas oceanisediminis TaxID=2836180 RepID=UPI001BDAEC42|nr:imidazole glycerol phosphate synthase subunit HisH [Alteromonas oceanisediminis]MBT0587482.1 imidazole glycerol phosphate synthase subunit HisH [Alteromonas oceanisediminis]